MVFALLAMLFSFGALVVAGQVRSRADEAKEDANQVGSGVVLASTTRVTDNGNPGGVVINHFNHGMAATLTVQ
jgi:hypothetical protein